MEKIYVETTIDIPSGKIKNLTIADQKKYFDASDCIKISGELMVDIKLIQDENEKTIHYSCPLELSLLKSKYNLKDINVSIYDYQYQVESNKCHIKIIYQVEGEDMSLEKFCSLDDDNLSYQLRDYLNLETSPKRCLNIDDNKITLLDPVIVEPPLKVETDIEQHQLEMNDIIMNHDDEESDKIDEQRIEEDNKLEITKENENSNIFKETYTSCFIYYRVHNNETIDDIAKKFNINKEIILKKNPNKEIKANALIIIPHV